MLLLAPQPRGRAGTHAPLLISVSVTPPLPEGITGRVAFEGLFWGMRGAVKYVFYLLFFRGQQLDSCFRCLEWVSAFLQRDIGDPLVIASALFTVTGHLHQALAFPGICMTVLLEGEKEGFSGSSRSSVGSLCSAPGALLGKNRLAQNSCQGD